MDRDTIKDELLSWIVNFVEQPNPLLNNWPTCPYAKSARLSNKIGIEFSSAETLDADVDKCLLQLDGKDVVLLLLDKDEIGPTELIEYVGNKNRTIMKNDFLILEDHPYSLEFINGSNMNFGKCIFLAIQKLSSINDASEKLMKNGYYDTWSRDNLAQVVSWRHVILED